MIFLTWGPVCASLALSLLGTRLPFTVAAESVALPSDALPSKPTTAELDGLEDAASAALPDTFFSDGGAYGRFLMDDSEGDEEEPGSSFDSGLRSSTVDTLDYDSMDMYDYMLMREGGPAVPPPLPPLAEDQDVPDIHELLNIERAKRKQKGKKPSSTKSNKEQEGENAVPEDGEAEKTTDGEEADTVGGGTVVAATAGSLVGASVIGAGVYFFKRKRAMTPEVTPAGFDGRFA